MSQDNTPQTLSELLHYADTIKAKMDAAISDYYKDDDAALESLSVQFDEVSSSIFSFSTTSLAELSNKCNFGKKLILPGHSDPELVSDIFAKLIKDIETLDKHMS